MPRSAPRRPPPGRRRLRPRRPASPTAPPGTSRDNPAVGDVRLAHAAQQAGLGEGNLAHRVRSDRKRARLRGRRRLRPVPDQRSGAGRRRAEGARRAGRLPDRRAHAARGADRRRVAVARARHAVPALSPTSPAASGGRRRKALAAGEDPDGDAATLDVLAALEKFPGVRPDPEAFIEALDPLQPRLYSISSSPKVHPGRVSLTVDTVRYDIDKRNAPRRRLDLPRRPRSVPATSSASMCRRRTPSACPPIRTCRSS